MKEFLSSIYNFVVSPQNIFAAAVSGAWHIAVIALYLCAVDFTLERLQISFAGTHWLLWITLLLDEVVIGLTLIGHSFHCVACSPIGLWVKSIIEAIVNSWK